MANKGVVFYYISPRGDNPVKDFIDSLPFKQKAKIFRIFQFLQEYGFYSITLHIKKLTGTSFWEIRILGTDNLRIIFFIAGKNEILVLHGFKKKTKKTPSKELTLAFKRFTKWQKRSS